MSIREWMARNIGIDDNASDYWMADQILTYLKAEIRGVKNPYKPKERCFGYQSTEPALNSAVEKFRQDILALLENR